jgi:hypothetical protein
MSIKDIGGLRLPCTANDGRGRNAHTGGDSVKEPLPGNPDGIQQGLVAYFDVLGFSAIASDEDIRKSANLIMEELSSIPSEIEKEKEQKFGASRPRTLTQSLIFADSILLWHNIPKEEGAQGESYHWYYFLSICKVLVQRMFIKGLPVRGAISEGTFFIQYICA